MDITATLQTLIPPQQKQGSINFKEMANGTKLTGRVVQSDADGMVVMDFGNFRAIAKIAFSVDKGQILNFNLVKTDDHITLKVSLPEIAKPSDMHIPKLAPSNSTIAWFEIISDTIYKELLSDIQTILIKNMNLPDGEKIPSNIQQSLEKLDAFFAPMAMGKGVFKLISQLKAFVEDSGVFFEKKIERAITNLMHTSLKVSAKDLSSAPEIKQIISEDLKPDLLILRTYLADLKMTAKGMDQKGLQRIQGALDQLLANVSQQQEISINRPNDPDAVQVFSHTLPFQDKDQQARFKVYYPRKKSGEKTGSHRVSLLLKLDRLGTVRADLIPVNKDLNITFFVQNEETRQTIEANYEVLTDTLDPIFNNLFLKAMVSAKKIDRFDTEDYNLASNQQIDIRA